MKKTTRKTVASKAPKQGGAMQRDILGRDTQGSRVQLKVFKVFGGDKPVSVRFLNPEPALTRIELPHGQKGDTVTVTSEAGAPGVDFDVTFLPRPGAKALTPDRAVQVEIKAGKQTLVERIFPDARRQRLRYRFLDLEVDPGLIYCAEKDGLFEPDANGHCPYHPGTRHGC